MTEVDRVILDVDMGPDDAMALLILLYAMKLGMLKIEAIVCASGNTGRENVVKNVVRILEVVGRTDIPVYRGALKPIIPLTLKLDDHDGKDGFGDVDWGYEPDISIVRDTPGAIAMYELVKKNPKNITIIGLAPLTNIGLASRLYDDFLENVKDVWIMGGNYQGVGTIGTAEFNFFGDPEAAYMLLNNTKAGAPIHILPWETCHSSNITLKWRFDVLGTSTLPEMVMITKAEKNIKENHKAKENQPWICCDGMLAASYAFPERTIVSETERSISVELHGSQTRGQVTVYSQKDRVLNGRYVDKIDFKFFQNLLLRMARVS